MKSIGDEVRPSTLARVYRVGNQAAPFVPSFQDFWRTTRFNQMKNYDPLDMFYWEHRMSVWHAGVVQEVDGAWDSIALFNSRRVLEPMLQVEERGNGEVLREICRQANPAVLDVPIN